MWRPHLTHSNTTVDLQWVSPVCYDWMTSCVTDVKHVHSHLSDHAAIISAILPPSPPSLITRTFRNWKKLDVVRFKEAFLSSLDPLRPAIKTLVHDQQGLDDQAGLVTEIVVRTMDTCVPKLPTRNGAKRWWDKATLSPLKASARRLRRLYQRTRDQPSRLAYIKAARAFREGIHEAKRSHWRSFLDSLSPSNLFTASKYATSNFAAPSLAVPPPSTAAGTLTSDPDEQAELLFQGTSAPTVPCTLNDLLPPTTLYPLPEPFTLLEVEGVIKALWQGKAPGRDEITNQVIQAGGPALAWAICLVANSCLRMGLYPSEWKVARTAILRKPHKPDYADPSVYRPIALLSCLSKGCNRSLPTGSRSKLRLKTSSRTATTAAGLSAPLRTRSPTSPHGPKTNGRGVSTWARCLWMSRRPFRLSTPVALSTP